LGQAGLKPNLLEKGQTKGARWARYLRKCDEEKNEDQEGKGNLGLRDLEQAGDAIQLLKAHNDTCKDYDETMPTGPSYPST
jgi:hypothetical protein